MAPRSGATVEAPGSNLANSWLRHARALAPECNFHNTGDWAASGKLSPMDKAQQWPALAKSNEDLLTELLDLLKSRVQGDPYSSDGAFANELSSLPRGLRAMAATHWMDVSLALDSLTWHFGNFGEPGLVTQTNEALLELNLKDLAGVFREAADLMRPFVEQMSPDHPPDELLEKAGLAERGRELDRKAWDLSKSSTGDSAIYEAWAAYVREHPERVFGS